MTLTDLQRLVAGVFYRRGLVEQWGRGTQKIVELCLKAGHPQPVFFEQAGSVVVRFIPRGYVPPLRVAYGLSPRHREILAILARAERLPLRSIVAQLTSPPAAATVRDDLLQLKKVGLIDSTGHGRGAVWFLMRASPAIEGGPTGS